MSDQPAHRKPEVAFSQGIFDAVCDHLGDGKSLAAIAKMPGMPSRASFFNWLRSETFQAAYPGMLDRYAKAREDQQHAYADDVVEISDTEKDASTARNRIAARQWHSAKLLPKVYGDRSHMDLNANVKHELPTAQQVADALKEIDDKL